MPSVKVSSRSFFYIISLTEKLASGITPITGPVGGEQSPPLFLKNKGGSLPQLT